MYTGTGGHFFKQFYIEKQKRLIICLSNQDISGIQEEFPKSMSDVHLISVLAISA